ncbi:DUF5615 family PIN-like protein [Engelhardtia mirabilis]|uniref:DUF5615 domain-containing protein n=1 Tax=Engelhardtia mirabilis TaxID=2528011 RepID=A0A518BDH0_9BACT|nr:hypothetical protein Pla133_00900 [Planctomycetes bacterium Pla133]QDU99353.1 hypothetical protein Pla86_00900 [Planctomycetes bacterium Pla86]
MRLLLDQNLSHRMLSGLEQAFPGSKHVRDFGMESTDDEGIWELAKSEGFAIVSKDTDFYQRSVLRGFPPKVVWVAVGNCPTGEIEQLLLKSIDALTEFDSDGERSFLVLE